MELFVDLYQERLFDDMGNALVALSLVLVRMLTFVHFAPIFSHKSVPAHARIALAFFLTTMFASKAIEEPIPVEGYSLIYVILVNIALGFVIGFTANILFTIVIAGGEMMDASMGFSAGQIFEPSLGGQTTIIGKFFGMLSAVIFFSVGGPEMLIEGMSNSFDAFSVYAGSLSLNIHKVIHLTGDIIRMGFVLVSPMVLTILINDLVLGLLSRASPQINAFQISFTIKPTIGSLMWILVLPLFFTGIANLFSSVSRLF